jgi:hypothetical protein
MKKVKLIFTAFAAVVVVSGALAFKTSRAHATIYCPDPNNNNFCSLLVNFKVGTGVGQTTNPCGTNNVFDQAKDAFHPCATQNGVIVIPTDQ